MYSEYFYIHDDSSIVVSESCDGTARELNDWKPNMWRSDWIVSLLKVLVINKLSFSHAEGLQRIKIFKPSLMLVYNIYLTNPSFLYIKCHFSWAEAHSKESRYCCIIKQKPYQQQTIYLFLLLRFLPALWEPFLPETLLCRILWCPVLLQ